MKRLDLELLNTFVTVLETGSLSAAAPRLFRSQSAVSEQIRKLEETVGIPLLSRSKTGAVPTPAGTRLVKHAHNLLELSEAAMKDVKGGQLEGELRLAVTEYFRPSVVTLILKRIQRTYPNLRLHVSVQKSLAIEGALQEDEFDIGIPMRIAGSGSGRRMVSSIRLAREPLRWAAVEAVDWAKDGPLPLILLPETCSLHRFVLRELRRRKIEFYIAHTASGVAGAQQALLAGLGITCLNESAVPGGAQIFRPRRQLPKMPDVEFVLLQGRNSRSPLVSQVKDILVGQFSLHDPTS